MSALEVTIGMDEVGRGALAGPVVVGAVYILLENEAVFVQELEAVLRRAITDSKKLTRLQRERAAEYIQKNAAWAVGESTAQEVDELGIMGATRLASDRALQKLSEELVISYILADAGLPHSFNHIPTEHIVRGDEQILSISCASIVAKVYRDAYMRAQAQQYPGYGWENNVGYGTALQRQVIRTQGLTSEHRRSFLSHLLLA